MTFESIELVAVDTVEGLRRTVGAGSELRLRVREDGASIDTAEAATDVAGVDSASFADGILRVRCTDSRAKARVVTRLADAGVDILDVDSEEASLEDVFAAYTTGDGAPTNGATSGGEGDSSESDDAATDKGNEPETLEEVPR